MRILLITLIVVSCKPAGVLPIKLDDYMTSTNERSFEMKNELYGNLLQYQASYPCTDSTSYNATSVVQLDRGDTITVYTPCLANNFNLNTRVVIQPYRDDVMLKTNKEIMIQASKNSSDYPYWLCFSCRFPNTIGIISENQTP